MQAGHRDGDATVHFDGKIFRDDVRNREAFLGFKRLQETDEDYGAFA